MKTKTILRNNYKTVYDTDTTVVAGKISNSVHRRFVRALKKKNLNIQTFLTNQINQFVKTV